MSYTTAYLQAHGQAVTVLRNRALTLSGLMPFSPITQISMKRSTKAVRDPGLRSNYWEGIALPESELASGEIFQIGTDKYLVQSVDNDVTSGALAWFAVKTNTVLAHKQYVEEYDANYNIIQGWKTINGEVDTFAQIITYALRQYDPGLLESARYIFWLPKSAGIKELDRIVLDDNNYQAESIDDVMLPGVVRIQASVDTRPGEDIV